MNRNIEARASVRCDLEAVRAVMRDPSALFTRAGLRPGTFLKEMTADLHDGMTVTQQVVLEIGVPTDGPVTATTLAWYPVSHDRVIPGFDGMLVATARPDGDSDLRVEGTYHPPLGLLGAGLDRIGLRRVACRTLADFTRELAALIEQAAIDGRGDPWVTSAPRADDLRPVPAGDIPPDHWLG
jgi:hypothetical protein